MAAITGARDEGEGDRRSNRGGRIHRLAPRLRLPPRRSGHRQPLQRHHMADRCRQLGEGREHAGDLRGGAGYRLPGDAPRPSRSRGRDHCMQVPGTRCPSGAVCRGSCSGPTPCPRRWPGPSHGADVHKDGTGALRGGRLYQLVRETGTVRERTLEITYLRPGARAYVFTFESCPAARRARHKQASGARWQSASGCSTPRRCSLATRVLIDSPDRSGLARPARRPQG
ncbi:hypothetical protein ACWCQN_28945 [Streptomyces sp. NPDC001984]